MKTWTEGLNVTKEDTQMANKYMKTCSASTVIRDLQLTPRDTTTRPPAWLKLKTASSSIGQVVEQPVLSCTAGGDS